MNSIMWTVLSLSVSGSILAGILLLMKPLLKDRLNKAFSYYIWLIVLLRMVLPVSASVNLIDGIVQRAAEKPAEQTMDFAEWEQDDITVNFEQDVAAPGVITQQTEKPAVQEPVTIVKAPSQRELNLQRAWEWTKEHLYLIWAAGAVISFLWYAFGYARFAVKMNRESYQPHEEDMAVFRRIAGKTRVKMLCNSTISTPLLMGVFFPRILIPAGEYCKNGNTERLENLLKHELMHYRRKDLLYKWASVIVSAVHWFNPMMILIRREISAGCELSCDEAVIRNMTQEEKLSYGETLLSFVVRRNLPKGVVATTFGERKTNLKKRIKSIAAYRRKPLWVLGLSLILALVLTGCAVVTGVTNGDKPEEVKVESAEIQEPKEEQQTAVAEKTEEAPAEEPEEPAVEAETTDSCRKYFYMDPETNEGIYAEIGMTYDEVKEMLNALALKRPEDGTLYTFVEGGTNTEDSEGTKASIEVTASLDGKSARTVLYFDDEADGKLLLTRIMWREANISSRQMQSYLNSDIKAYGIPQYRRTGTVNGFFIWQRENGYYAQHHMFGAVSWRYTADESLEKLLSMEDNGDLYFIKAENIGTGTDFLTDIVGEQNLPEGWIRPENIINYVASRDWENAEGITVSSDPKVYSLDGYAIYQGELYYALRIGGVIKEGYPTHLYVSLNGKTIFSGTDSEVF